jgi:GTP-binding protein
MIIRSARYIKSSTNISQCPEGNLPELAFIGRSNVGKSSLINMLTGFNKLAKTSGDPGKTRTINHFLINDNWYLVDLPGYGYAKVAIKQREDWTKASGEYIMKRENLLCLFVLVDPRHKPQKSDIEFMEFLGMSQIPFTRVFTKSDKMSRDSLARSVREYDAIMLMNWESLPVTFITSTVTKAGRMDILDFIEESMNNFSKQE